MLMLHFCNVQKIPTRKGRRVEGKQRNMAMRQREEEEGKDSFETEGFRMTFGCLVKFLAPARHPSSPVALSGVNNGLHLVGLTNESERERREKQHQ